MFFFLQPFAITTLIRELPVLRLLLWNRTWSTAVEFVQVQIIALIATQGSMQMIVLEYAEVLIKQKPELVTQIHLIGKTLKTLTQG